MLLLRSALYILGMMISAFIIAPLTVLMLPLPFAQRYRFANQWARFNLWSLKLVCGLGFQVHGTENIPDKPAIILCKHQSAWETLALQRIFPPIAWVLKRELLWMPIFGWGLASIAPIAIDRSAGRKAIQQIIDKGTQRLAAGRWVVLFPEGTRIAPGQKGRYRLGGTVLAEESGYPVMPVAHNAGWFWRRNSFLRRPGTIDLVIGPLIESRGKNAAEIMSEVENWIEGQMPALDERAREQLKNN